MKGHFFSSYANYRLNKTRLTKLFGQPQRIRVYDIGCGPATALLGLCDLFPGIKLRYYGIDKAQAMHKKAKELWDAAVELGLVSRKSVAIFRKSWNSIDVAQIEQPCSVLLNFSYFFASASLDTAAIGSLAKFVRKLVELPNVRKLCVSHINSITHVANENYVKFKKQLGELGQPFVTSTQKETTIEYRKKRHGIYTGSETFAREFFVLKS